MSVMRWIRFIDMLTVANITRAPEGHLTPFPLPCHVTGIYRPGTDERCMDDCDNFFIWLDYLHHKDAFPIQVSPIGPYSANRFHVKQVYESEKPAMLMIKSGKLCMTDGIEKI